MKQRIIPALGHCLSHKFSLVGPGLGAEQGVWWTLRPPACRGADKGCRPPTSSRTLSSWDDLSQCLLPSMQTPPLLTLTHTNSFFFSPVRREFCQLDREACFFCLQHLFFSHGHSHLSLLCSPPRVVSSTFRAEHYPSPIGEGV